MLRTILPARTSYFRVFLLMIGMISVLDLAFSVLAPAAGLIIPVDYALYLKISASIIGGILLENLFRNTPADQIWSMKHICLGIGTIYGFDVFLYSDALLFRRIDPGLWAARGIVDALAVPLIALSAIRNPSLSIKIHMSRDAVFYSTTLLGAGIYFLLVGLAGYYIRAVGGNWGDVLSVIILTLSILLVVTLLASSTIRSHIKLFINENFFSYKYDYRKEWAQLIKTISSDTDYVRLHKRAIKSLADVVDSPAGILWLHREPDAHLCAGGELAFSRRASDAQRRRQADARDRRAAERRQPARPAHAQAGRDRTGHGHPGSTSWPRSGSPCRSSIATRWWASWRCSARARRAISIGRITPCCASSASRSRPISPRRRPTARPARRAPARGVQQALRLRHPRHQEPRRASSRC